MDNKSTEEKVLLSWEISPDADIQILKLSVPLALTIIIAVFLSTREWFRLENIKSGLKQGPYGLIITSGMLLFIFGALLFAIFSIVKSFLKASRPDGEKYIATEQGISIARDGNNNYYPWQGFKYFQYAPRAVRGTLIEPCYSLVKKSSLSFPILVRCNLENAKKIDDLISKHIPRSKNSSDLILSIVAFMILSVIFIGVLILTEKLSSSTEILRGFPWEW